VLGHANAWWETGDSQLGDEEVGRALILIDFIYNDFDAKTTVRDVVCAPARFILNLEKHWDARKGKDQRGWLDRKIKEARKLAELGLASGQVTLTPYRLRG